MEGTGEQGAGIRPVTHPAVQWPECGQGQWVTRGLDSGMLVPEAGWEDRASVEAFLAVCENFQTLCIQVNEKS